MKLRYFYKKHFEDKYSTEYKEPVLQYWQSNVEKGEVGYTLGQWIDVESVYERLEGEDVDKKML